MLNFIHMIYGVLDFLWRLFRRCLGLAAEDRDRKPLINAG